MVKRKRAALLALACAQVLTAAYAASPAKGASATGGPPDEVIVEAQKERLTHLQMQLEKAQDDFFARFNKVNTNPEYQTHCERKALYGSHILDHVCTPQFVDTANEKVASWLVGTLQGSAYEPLAPEDPSTAIRTKMPDYRRKVLEVGEKDSQLAKISRDFESLKKHYEAVRKAKFKNHWFVWE
jgi:hypothetical protein